MKIKSIKKCQPAHTWDIEVLPSHSYILSNGCISHNTSSQVSGATNGVEAIRDYVLEKSSKDTSSTFVAPELKKYKQYYKLAWDIDQEDYIKVMAVIQKFIDQSISTNIYYDVRKTESGRISSNKLKRDLLMAYKYGLKTRYYCNSYIPESEAEAGTGCDSGACAL